MFRRGGASFQSKYRAYNNFHEILKKKLTGKSVIVQTLKHIQKDLESLKNTRLTAINSRVCAVNKDYLQHFKDGIAETQKKYDINRIYSNFCVALQNKYVDKSITERTSRHRENLESLVNTVSLKKLSTHVHAVQVEYFQKLKDCITEKQEKYNLGSFVKSVCKKSAHNIRTIGISAAVLINDSSKENASGLIPENVIEPIPEPPPIPEVSDSLNVLGEPTFASLGLGGWTPVGMVEQCLEYIHVSLGIPWWETIMIGTIIIRICLFPLVVIAQRNAVRMNNHLPQMQALQLKMTEARQTGNKLDAARYSQELMIFMKEKGLNPFKNMIVPLAQAPVFISFFMSLRGMANVPIESLRTGGLFWFQDLTVPDQFFALPIITSLTLWATIELGTDSARISSQNLQIMRYLLRAMPLVILPFTVNFPGAILCYWVSTNFISLIQVGFLKIPTVRNYFNIDPYVNHSPEILPIKQKGFSEGLKDSWTNIKITKELEERSRLDEMQFQRAGKGSVVKTYKYDPTKQINPNAVNAKKR